MCADRHWSLQIHTHFPASSFQRRLTCDINLMRNKLCVSAIHLMYCIALLNSSLVDNKNQKFFFYRFFFYLRFSTHTHITRTDEYIAIWLLAAGC